jgi:hypothetical protein
LDYLARILGREFFFAMVKKTKRRWYENTNGRYPKTLEVALASGEPKRRAFAWALLMYADAHSRGFQVRAAEKIGCAQGQISAWLTGERDLSKNATLRIAKGLQMDVNTLYRPDHPFAIVLGPNEVYEPGDTEWVHWYSLMRLANPDVNPSIAWLIKNIPAIFPLDFEAEI